MKPFSPVSPRIPAADPDTNAKKALQYSTRPALLRIANGLYASNSNPERSSDSAAMSFKIKETQ